MKAISLGEVNSTQISTSMYYGKVFYKFTSRMGRSPCKKKAAPASCVPKQARKRAHDTDHVYNATVSSNIKNVTSSIPLSQISLSQTRPLPKDDFMFGCPSCNRTFSSLRGQKIHQAHCENLLLFACTQGRCKRSFKNKASRTKHLKKCPFQAFTFPMS